MFQLALYQPQIPPNTGNIIRLVANNGSSLHLIEPLGFDLSTKQLRRAGLDYHDLARVTVHASFDACIAALMPQRVLAITTKGTIAYTDVDYNSSDLILFGSETSGLPAALMAGLPTEQRIRIPMCAGQRSLNLSNAAAIVSYEAWRQQGFKGAKPLEA